MTGRQRVRVAGKVLDVGYIPATRASAPTLVFLHEGLGSIDLWREFPAHIAASTGFSALIYSRYGNGFSEALDEPRAVSYMHDEARLVLPELLERFSIEAPMLVGHSDGASIALIFAATYPAQTRALVLEAPHVFVEDISVKSIAAIGEAYATSGLAKRMQRHHTDAERTFRGWNTIWLDPAFRSWSIVDLLPSVTAPILAIQGADDEYGTLAQLQALDDGTAGDVDRLILDRCGHAPHRDRSEIVESSVTAWLLQVEGTRYHG